jgi:hypothetical protein
LVSVVCISLGIGFYGVKTGDTGETIEPEERLQVRGLPIMERKETGDTSFSLLERCLSKVNLCFQWVPKFLSFFLSR